MNILLITQWFTPEPDFKGLPFARELLRRGHDVQVKQLPNPRREAESHYYNPTYQGLAELGVRPHLLTDENMHGIFQLVEEHKDNIRQETIFRGVRW